MNLRLTSLIVLGGIMVFIIVGSLFYWYQLRPAKIRHDCSWHRVVDAAKPAEPAITKEDVEASKIVYNQCVKDAPKKERGLKFNNPYNNLFDTTSAFDKLNLYYAEQDCKSLLKYEKVAVPPKAETHWYRQATKPEYDFCLHESGLQ